jgi:hypothetical protein
VQGKEGEVDRLAAADRGDYDVEVVSDPDDEGVEL